MVAFPEKSCKSARWKDFLGVVAATYPDIEEDCKQHIHELQTLSQSRDRGWGYLNKKIGFDIGAQKKGTKTYMTLDTYMKSSRDIAHFRAFLAHSCYANKLFSGDGFTYNDNGDKQAEEFVMADAAIDEIEGVSCCDMEVVAP